MAAKRRKPGQWIEVAKARRNKDLVFLKGHGLSNIPRLTDVGSAAYRRLMEQGKRKK